MVPSGPNIIVILGLAIGAALVAGDGSRPKSPPFHPL
ncbi:hypothetical protein SAMN05444161_4819 [Rhizobiales bacterium GAS191]|nr:hypothetical protein SAMN05444161_4819 [Rhizobiales bacterium GAS191]